MSTSGDLSRFVHAQDPVYDRVVMELRLGRKTSHWMWFIFPQIAGLGQSPMSRTYAIVDLAEARAYLAHPVLGPRLLECTRLVNRVADLDIHAIFGHPDNLKFHAAMTLFQTAARSAEEREIFHTALVKYFGGDLHVSTQDALGNSSTGL